MEKFAKDYIIDALFLLLEKEEYDKISVTDICAKAGVSRLSYYRLFGDKKNIVKSFFYRAEDEFMKFYPDVGVYIDEKKKVQMVFQGLLNHRKEFDIIIKNDLKDIYLEYLNESYVALFKRLKYQVSPLTPYVYAGLFYNLSISWATDGYKESVEEMTNVILKAILK